MLCFLYSRIFCAQGSLKIITENRVLHHHKRFLFIKIKITDTYSSSFTQRDSPKHFNKITLSPLKYYTTVCKYFIYIHCCVKTKLQSFTHLPFHCCVKQFMVLIQTSPWFSSFTYSPPLLHCCAFFTFFLHLQNDQQLYVFYLFGQNQTYDREN